MQDYQPQPVNTPQVPISPFDVKSLIGVREKSRPTELTPHLYSVGYDRMGDEGKALIDVKDIRQRDGSECGTAAVMSVIQFYKVGTDDMDELREQLETTEEQGTTPTNIVSYLKSIGLQVEDREGMDLNDLANYWEKGWPVICCIQEYGDLKEESEDPAGVAIEEQLNFENGHWVVVIGGPAQGVLYIQDPAIDNLLEDVGINVKRGRSRIPAIKFLKIWHDEDGNGKKYMRYGIAVGPPSHLNGHGNKSMPTGKPYSHTLASTPRSHGNVFGQGQVTSLKIPMENNISPYNHSEDQPERRVKDLNEPEKEPPSHEFSSTQFNILDQPLLDKLAKIRDRIPDEDLAEDGREEAPHVTVLFGLHTNNPEDVQQVVQNWLQMRGTDPVKARLGAVSLFPANNETAQRGGDYQDVLKVDVESDELHDLNRVLKENLDRTDTYPEYHPHLTLAYLNPGAGWLYVSDDELGDELEFSKLVFSDKNRNEVEIDLTGESDEPGWRCENPPCEWSMLQAGDEDMDMEKYPKPVIHDQEEWERCHPDRYNRSELKALPEEPEQPQPEEPETPPTPASQPDLEPMEVELVEDDEPSTATPVPVEPAPDPYGLTDDEIYALGKWTGAESSNLRQQELSSWRGGYASKLHQDFDSAVRKLPPYQGTIYRGIRVSAQEAARLPYKLGETFILDMTSSASKRKTKAEAEAMRERYDIAKYHEDVGVIFVVAANNGADVSPYQQVGYLKHEDEVLLRKGTFYRVTDVQDHYVRREDEEGQAYGKPRLIYYIALEEIPEQPSKGLKRLGLLQMKELPTCPDGRKMPPNIRSCGGTDGWKGWKSIEPGIGSDFTFYRQAYDRWRVKPDVLGERRLRRAYENGKPADELAIKNDEEFRLTRESGTQERFTNSRSQSSGLPNEGGLLAGQEQEDSSGLPNRTPTGDTCPDGSPINPRTRTCTDKQGYTQGYPGVDEMHIEQDDRMVGGQRRGKDLEEAKPSQPPVQSSPPVETKPTQEPEYVSDPAFQVYLNQAESLLPQPYSFSGSNPQAMAARQALLNYIASLRRSQPEKSLNSPFDENWLKSLFKGVGDLDSPPDPSLPHPIQPHLTKPERRRARRSDNIGNGVAEKKWGEKCPDGSLKPVGSGSCQGRQADSWDGIIDKNNEPGWPDYPDYAPVVGLDIRDPEEREKPLAGHLFPNKKALPDFV